MTVTEFLQVIAQLSAVVLVITSMLAMGLSLTIPMILQPLRNGRLVVMALLANFVLVPLMAYLMTVIMPLDESLRSLC